MQLRASGFCAAMFAPTILTILMVQTGNKDAPPGIALVGGIISGIICGTLLGRRIGKTPQSKVGLAVALAFLLGAACILMNCFGCLATGYNVNFH